MKENRTHSRIIHILVFLSLIFSSCSLGYSSYSTRQYQSNECTFDDFANDAYKIVELYEESRDRLANGSDETLISHSLLARVRQIRCSSKFPDESEALESSVKHYINFFENDDNVSAIVSFTEYIRFLDMMVNNENWE